MHELVFEKKRVTDVVSARVSLCKRVPFVFVWGLMGGGIG